jgi:hypothetical protein
MNASKSVVMSATLASVEHTALPGKKRKRKKKEKKWRETGEGEVWKDEKE